MANPAAINEKKVLLLGSLGMIGNALGRVLQGPNLTSFSHQDLDITDYGALEKTFLRFRPEVVLNAAAFTRVDDCEKFRETAFLVNAQAPGHIATLCKRYGALLVHLSTDYIFDGETDRPYSETHPANPINYYGTTKWEAEKKIVSSGCSYLIVRTSWIFGQNGDNFVKKLLQRALAGAKLRAPIDQIGAPTKAGDVAAAILRLLAGGNTGIIHFTNSGHCSRHEQATTILRLYGLNNSVEAATNEGLHLPAKRPRFSVLDISRYVEITGHSPRSWEQSTAEYIAFLKEDDKLRS
ncbi:MAG: dTDP-4-dehydrorhamnose reductase [Acidobacteria bacterium]|nr:MAG: dTDP-4-dehydrorhamnose reductase [Acidobacteriota bacterium]